jgi:hypothetical protein
VDRLAAPGSDGATPDNRMDVVGIVLLLAVVPGLVRRRFGPVRSGWRPRALRVAGYLTVLVLIAAKAARARYADRLGAYFVLDGRLWVAQVMLLVFLAGYVAGLLILTSQRMRPVRLGLPIGTGLVTGLVLYAFHPLGQSAARGWPSLAGNTCWWAAALAVPAVLAVVAARRSARDKPPDADLVQYTSLQGTLAATVALATAALALATLTAVAVALFPHLIPLTQGRYDPSSGICPTCGGPNNVVIPPGLRYQYWVR